METREGMVEKQQRSQRAEAGGSKCLIEDDEGGYHLKCLVKKREKGDKKYLREQREEATTFRGIGYVPYDTI